MAGPINGGGVAIGDGGTMGRAGQPTNAVVIKTALAMAPILRISDRFFMSYLP
jgi:hypothetical protein